MYDTILVATDGSDSANRAVEQALDLASMFDAELYGISVVDTRRYGDSMLSGSSGVIDDLSDRAEEVLAGLEAQADVGVTTTVRRGRPHEEIERYADTVDADLIVLGNRGLGASGEIGSTAERVVRYIDRPVLTA
ncbi:universal stress protein [Natronorubrum sulfidifaciens]|uniref:UspA domain-containing protein n=1 Tax=Natronorubrum sulfidifaciens JCM 14089 TaxID=1230460 RepID=L9W571_9EURY|nr:universal stress protein [Natronorubrum sulfidifaciens]ELY44600.1 UspA domain-containing protein [Natronorubrum sulfidifaciens JCM 14089]